MCKKLLLVVALLSISSFAYAQTVIDDFESYFDDPGVQAAWTETMPVVHRTLLTVGAGEGYQSMSANFAIPGGWKLPDNPTDFDSVEISSVTRTFDAPLDWQPGGQMNIMLRAHGDWNLSMARYLVVVFDGTKAGGVPTHSETWIAGDPAAWLGWSPDVQPESVLGTMGNDGTLYPNWGAPRWDEYNALPRLTPEKGWMEFVLTDHKFSLWSGIPQWTLNSMADFDAMTSMSFWLVTGWNDTTGDEGGSKTDSTGGIHWPAGHLEGGFDVDYIYYIPEPATIALLGLGGLALIRRKK